MKTISLVLSALTIVSACSKTVNNTYNLPEKSSLESPTQSSVEMIHIRRLIESPTPNFALAELLARTVTSDKRDEVKSFLSVLTPEEASSILLEIEKTNKIIRSQKLYHGMSYQDNKLFLSNTLQLSDGLGKSYGPMEQLRTSTFAYVKEKALTEIINSYDKRAMELAQSLAEEIAFEIGKDHQDLASQIELAIETVPKHKAIEQIQKSRPVLEKIDQYFKTSKLSENEQYVTTMVAVLAGAIYLQVKDNNGFRKIVAKGMKLVRDINQFKENAKEFVLIINTLETHIVDTEKNIRNLKDGMNDGHKDIFKLYKEAEKGLKGSPNVETKNIIEFLEKNVMRGKAVKPNGTNQSILSKQVNINANLQKSVDAAMNLTNNLSNIVNTSIRMAELLGAKPSKDLQKVLDEAQKVGQVISTVQSAMAGFATGGFMGAVSALSSGPLQKMMGGGASADAAKLKEISKKLDIVLSNQKTMMIMQQETMEMIKNLAILVDDYHQKEMAALSELRELLLINQEFQKVQIHEKLRNCERMINAQIPKLQDRDFSNIDNTRTVQTLFKSNITSMNDILDTIRKVDSYAYENCQSAMAEAFGNSSSDESPLRLIFSSIEGHDLYKFDRDIYGPLKESITFISETSSFDSIPMHLPMKEFKSLVHKASYVEFAKNAGNDNNLYDLENLFSVKTLERYLTSLLVLYPVLEMNKSDWEMSFEEIVNENIAVSQDAEKRSRSLFYLNNALKLIQSSIAQESLLAGEPLLVHLYEKFNSKLLGSKLCGGAPSYICNLRNNKLLMKNLVHYTLTRGSSTEAYKQAYENGDTKAIAALLNSSVKSDSIEIVKNKEMNEIILTVLNEKSEKVLIKLPTPDKYLEDRIMYSENMEKLLLMQELVLEALEKSSHVKRTKKSEDLTKLIFIATGA